MSKKDLIEEGYDIIVEYNPVFVIMSRFNIINNVKVIRYFILKNGVSTTLSPNIMPWID